MQLFHYHLVTSKVREVEARYIGKLGFTLVARHGRIDEDTTSFESGHGWEELDELGFKLRLSELERGAVNVVVQPGQWELPRLDHLGFALDEDDFVATLARAELRELRVQEHGGRRTFISTNAGYRLELHPPREWLDDFLEGQSELTLAELQLRADDPQEKADALAELLGLKQRNGTVEVGETMVKFIPGGPRADRSSSANCSCDLHAADAIRAGLSPASPYWLGRTSRAPHRIDLWRRWKRRTRMPAFRW